MWQLRPDLAKLIHYFLKPEYSVTKLNNYYLVNNKALVLKQQQQKKNHNKLWFLPARLLLPTP